MYQEGYFATTLKNTFISTCIIFQVESLKVFGAADFKPLMYEKEDSWNIYSWIKIMHGTDIDSAHVPYVIKAQMIDAVKIHHSLGIVDSLNSTLLRTCRDINYVSLFMLAFGRAGRVVSIVSLLFKIIYFSKM